MPTAESTAITSRLDSSIGPRLVGLCRMQDTEENKLIYTELFNQYADALLAQSHHFCA